MRLVSLFILLCLCSCSGTYTQKLNFNPEESLRVAVLPFAQLNEVGEFVQNNEQLLVDGVPLISEKSSDNPGVIVNKSVRRQLAESRLDLLPAGIISVELEHHGFRKSDGTIDLKRLYSASPKEICSHLLNCDAVLRGKVKTWDRSYYGLETVNSVEFEVELVARDGRQLFFANAKDSDSRGLTKVPTGFSSLVLEPIKGLDQKIIVDLVDEMSKKMLAKITDAGRNTYDAALPSIYGSTHDAITGYLTKNKALTVLLYGTPGMHASFSIGQELRDLPMIERSKGRYIGFYYPDSDVFNNAVVSVAIKDSYQRIVRQNIKLNTVTYSGK